MARHPALNPVQDISERMKVVVQRLIIVLDNVYSDFSDASVSGRQIAQLHGQCLFLLQHSIDMLRHHQYQGLYELSDNLDLLTELIAIIEQQTEETQSPTTDSIEIMLRKTQVRLFELHAINEHPLVTVIHQNAPLLKAFMRSCPPVRLGYGLTSNAHREVDITERYLANAHEKAHTLIHHDLQLERERFYDDLERLYNSYQKNNINELIDTCYGQVPDYIKAVLKTQVLIRLAQFEPFNPNLQDLIEELIKTAYSNRTQQFIAKLSSQLSREHSVLRQYKQCRLGELDYDRAS
ncbi:hypothetical protein [Idiomarina abyssalis]|uniref:Uncharacterized protein n=1 Tax=Idiomarina abyssalis TaxID=86102 RepID=A0A8I1KHJ1_9GAMM|nr:hypothetical protein [Idiomarina abyssalis]MBJ7265463.1 hypothetical protein [Idiomarina abyssalis]MBJ7316863.1 hypothetical protein [Idiomarina abyssalis]